MIEEIEVYDFSEHQTGNVECEACEEGYPHRCRCGGLVHAKVVKVKGDGFVEVTHCDQCDMPEAVGPA